MAANMVIQENGQLTEKQAEAYNLHQEIMLNGQMAANYLIDFCKDLKKMRDNRLYTELGYDSFEDYVQQAVGIKQRMAYQYISTYEKLGSTFLQSNAKIGITKLSMLTQLSPLERQELADTGELADMSAQELREKIKELDKAQKQLSMLNEEKKEAEAAIEEKEEKLNRVLAERDLLEKELEKRAQLEQENINRVREEAEREAEKQIAQLEQKSAPDEETLEQIRTEAQLEAEKKLKDEIEKAEKKAARAKEKELSQKHEEEMEKLRHETQKTVEALTTEKEQFTARLVEMEKQQKISAKDDPNVLKFQFYFDELKNAVQNLVDAKADIKDRETADKLGQAIAKYLNLVRDRLAKEEQS